MTSSDSRNRWNVLGSPNASSAFCACISEGRTVQPSSLPTTDWL